MAFIVEEIFASGDIARLLLAVLVGGVIGMEREIREKAAGFRTMMLICTGAMLFTKFSLEIGGDIEPTRIASNIVSGIGFLGAGVIIQQGSKIRGLTTASTIWLVAALGMGIGAGRWTFVLSATGVILVILWAFPRLERWMENLTLTRTYEVMIANDEETYLRLNKMWDDLGLNVIFRKVSKEGAERVCAWRVSGKPQKHQRIVALLMEDEDVHQMHYGDFV